MQDLAERQADTIRVKLWWSPEDDKITVTVRDTVSGECFAIHPPNDKALDAFYHPYTYKLSEVTVGLVEV